MRLPHPSIFGALYGLSEVFLAVTRRSGRGAVSRDRCSVFLLWAVILVSIFVAVSIQVLYPKAQLPRPRAWYLLGVLLFIAGIALRWFSIFYLGRFFTVDVAIATQHKLIDSGPYRFIRHPSYTGALMAFAGFGLCLGNWLSILAVTLPIFGAFLWRIRVEEHALLAALGDDYRAYIRRTKRLIPLLY